MIYNLLLVTYHLHTPHIILKYLYDRYSIHTTILLHHPNSSYGWNICVWIYWKNWSYFLGLWVTFFSNIWNYMKKSETFFQHNISGRVKIYQLFDQFWPICLSICLYLSSLLELIRVSCEPQSTIICTDRLTDK